MVSVVSAVIERRLGLKAIYRDHAATWTERTGREGARDRREAALWYFATPTVIAVGFVVWHVHLQGLGQLLSGVTVFTALLFGLLVLMFNTGVTLRKDSASIASAHGLRELIGHIRANTTWAILVSFLLALTLVIAAATTAPTESTPWGFTPVIVWLFVHLVLTLLSILRRLRTAFNYITR
jgi:hypothetical protein